MRVLLKEVRLENLDCDLKFILILGQVHFRCGTLANLLKDEIFPIENPAGPLLLVCGFCIVGCHFVCTNISTPI